MFKPAPGLYAAWQHARLCSQFIFLFCFVLRRPERAAFSFFHLSIFIDDSCFGVSSYSLKVSVDSPCPGRVCSILKITEKTRSWLVFARYRIVLTYGAAMAIHKSQVGLASVTNRRPASFASFRSEPGATSLSVSGRGVAKSSSSRYHLALQLCWYG